MPDTPSKTTTSGRITGRIIEKLNWKIALALSVPIAAAMAYSAVMKCDLTIGISGLSQQCEDK